MNRNLRQSLACATALSFLGAALLSGCATVTDTVYLNDLTVHGPVQQPPVHLSKDPKAGDVHITPRFSLNRPGRLEGETGGNTYPTDVLPVPANNFHWSMPDLQFGIDLDVSIIDAVAFNAGLTASASDGEDLWGGNFGIGFPFDRETIAGRFEVGVQLQTMVFDAYSVLVREVTPWYSNATERSVYYFHDVDRTTPWNMYGSLTLNSATEGVVTWFANFAVSRQTTARFTPKHAYALTPIVEYIYTDTRADNTSTFIIFTPGVAFNISPTVSLMLGARVLQNFSAELEGGTLFAPMLQLDIKP